MEDILTIALNFIPGKYVYNMRINKKFNILCMDETLWKNIMLNEHNMVPKYDDMTYYVAYRLVSMIPDFKCGILCHPTLKPFFKGLIFNQLKYPDKHNVVIN